MRLSKIKLAGFKSFVDPTTLNLPSNLVGIVGPNGCGKSNTIDAVRWVMGESSAKHLRGASMDDVIFNGSNTRKPVAQASIELVFDNSDGSLGGEFARFSEISVRRQVSREGQATYFLNGTKCRRRDITDLFLGTGLGPRSYAIIEQGMISRLIEAKPQELRVYLEEAAGISKYKERRRETENRIRHTRDHLDRLSDLRDEIDKQIAHLKRQADTAEKFARYKTEQERLEAETVALHLRELESQASVIDGQLTEASLELEKRLATLRETEAFLEEKREARVENTEVFNDVQARFYKLGNEISRTEQSISHRAELKQRQAREKQDQQTALDQVQNHLRNDQNRLEEIQMQLNTLEPEIETAAEEQAMANEQLQESEERYAQWQASWDDFNQRSSEPAQRAQVEKARMEQLERQIANIAQRMERIQSQLQQISAESSADLVEELSERVVELEEIEAAGQEQLETTLQSIDVLTVEGRELRENQDQHRREAQSKRGRLASLQALQQAALGKDQGKADQWLKQHGFDNNQRLGESLTVDAGWDVAVETVLGSFLEAVSVKEIDNLERSLSELDKQSIVFFEADAATGHLTENTLADKVKGPNMVTSMLSNIIPVEELADALRIRKTLAPYQSIITRDGLWIGPGWLRVSRGDQQKQGVLKRKEEIETLTSDLEALDERIEQDDQIVQEQRHRLMEMEVQRKELQQAANQNHKAVAETRSRLEAQKNQIEQQLNRKQSLENELEELTQAVEEEQMVLEEALTARNAALAEIDDLGKERDHIQRQRDEFRNAVEQARQSLSHAQKLQQHQAIQLESLKSSRTAVEENIGRYQQQSEQYQEKLELMVETEMENDSATVEMLEEELERLLSDRVRQEKKLNEARDQLAAVENALKELENGRQRAEQGIQDQRSVMEKFKLSMNELNVRTETYQEQLDQTQFFKHELLQGLKDTSSVASHEQLLTQMEARIKRLGPINLAAIDEYKEQSERKVYLDSQNEDLVKALETLEAAIAKIDRESKARFKETFERVNASLQEMFPKLFGGGQAYLEMTDSDLLTTGVSIMARPPGKRISHIHLMSGGEKALTAVAMVFAIFELNPAPFCMLDEVDAPLDEANVGRFCELVRAMSERVQFIFITHNKTTMELAEQLVGVTMREPGVSRQVDVDLSEAASMATG